MSQPTTGDETAPTEVRPGHLAVLVRTNRQAAMVRDALGEAGVPAVINGAGSVFATEPARAWLALLEALERPGLDAAGARAAALTPFVGWTAPSYREPTRTGAEPGRRSTSACTIGHGFCAGAASPRC